jgi:hypothetical protein
VVRPGIMENSVEYMRVWIAGTFGAKFENSPLLAMLAIEKLDKLVGRISVGFLGPDRAGSRGYNDEVCNVAKIKTCFRVSHPRASNDLTEYGSLAMDQQGTGARDGPPRRAIPALFGVPRRTAVDDGQRAAGPDFISTPPQTSMRI